METKKRTFVKVPIVDLQKKYEGRAFNMKIDNNGNEPVRVRLFGDGSVFVQAVGGQGGDTPTPGPGGQGLTPEERAAIVSLFRMATYTGDNAEGYIEILESHATLTGIDAVFTQGAAVIYPTASLDDLKQYLVVTAQYDDGTTMNVTDYTLSGTLTAGISTITATYQGFSDTFTVNVTAQPVMTGINAVFTQGAAVIYPTASLDSLRQYLTVDANFSDGSSIRVNEYTLSGTLTAGISTITATYQGFSDTFTVNVTAQPVMTGINAIFTQGAAVIYPTASLDSLRQYLTVDANFSDGSSIRVNAYTLSGTLAAGTSTITAAYEGFTDDFTVIVTAVPTVTSIDAVYTQGNVIVYDGDILDKLKYSLVVTANYSDGTTQVVDDYTLSGTLATGISTITVTREGLTDTFNVEVSALHAMYSIDGSTFRYCVPTQDPPYYQYREDRFRWSYVDFNLLANGGRRYRIAVTFTNEENNAVRIGLQAFSQIALNAVANNESWIWSQDQWDSTWQTLNVGSSAPGTYYVDINVPYYYWVNNPDYYIKGFRFTLSYAMESSAIREGLSIKNLDVIDITDQDLTGIQARWAQGSTPEIHPDDSIEILRQWLEVVASYSDSSYQLTNGYTLTGTLEVGTSTITVEYEGYTTTINVEVTAN